MMRSGFVLYGNTVRLAPRSETVPTICYVPLAEVADLDSIDESWKGLLH
jgi:hypothetical protein